MLVNAPELPEIQILNTGIERSMEMHADALLQASRRVDWRFLLPNPDLGDVAYIGPSDELHIKALNAFSKSVVVFTQPPSTSEQTPKFDVVVVCAPTMPRLVSAGQLLRPGGFLYIETYGLSWLIRRGWRFLLHSHLERFKINTPRRYMATLSAHGLIPTGTFWHWPDFENCTRIVPLDNLSGFELGINNPTNGLLNHWRSNLLGWALRNGIVAFSVPCVSYVAQQAIE